MNIQHFFHHCTFLTTVFVLPMLPTTTECHDRNCNISRILNELLNDYDKGIRPFLNDRKPVVVTVGIWVLSIDSINVMDMDFRIDLFFRQEWMDPRLVHTHHDALTVDNSMLHQIWVPDTYFENSKSSTFHSVTVPNKMLRIQQNGTVLYNARISLQVSCPMNLIDFPVDTQTCQINIESYGYDIRHIVFRWEDRKENVSIGEKVKNLPQYNITQLYTFSGVSYYVIGNWSTLTFRFTLKRQAGHFFLHLYAPCILVVTLSWIAFFIPRDSVAARISLGITSVLTTTTIMNIQNNSMPKVSYIKLADWYLIVCFLFVFGTLVEFTIILYLSTYQKRREVRHTRQRQRHTLGIANSYPFPRSGRTGSDDIFYNGSRASPASVAFLLERNERHRSMLKEEYEASTTTTTTTTSTSTSTAHSDRSINVPFQLDQIDECARLLFPISFVLFNAVYWMIFLRKYADLPGIDL